MITTTMAHSDIDDDNVNWYENITFMVAIKNVMKILNLISILYYVY